MFTSIEVHNRTRAFDHMVEDTHNALVEPEVAQALGGLATELLEINDGAFLPNIRHGVLTIPEEYQDTANVAIVPLNRREMHRANVLTEPLFEAKPLSWPETTTTSDMYGLDLTDEMQAFLNGDEPIEEFKGMRRFNFTRAVTTGVVDQEDDGTFSGSRPAIMTKAWEFKGPPKRYRAAMLAHELVHVRDMVEDGPLYSMMAYRAATEGQAYYVGGVIAAPNLLARFNARNAYKIDELRHALNDPESPFTPTPAFVDALKAKRVI
jgi:hypothetical protein